MSALRTPAEQDSGHAAEQRLQVGAALVLGALTLLAIFWRAYRHGMLPAGWWRFW